MEIANIQFNWGICIRISEHKCANQVDFVFKACCTRCKYKTFLSLTFTSLLFYFLLIYFCLCIPIHFANEIALFIFYFYMANILQGKHSHKENNEETPARLSYRRHFSPARSLLEYILHFSLFIYQAFIYNSICSYVLQPQVTNTSKTCDNFFSFCLSFFTFHSERFIKDNSHHFITSWNRRNFPVE
jgi:hypothetical protein